jgi:hypothetical protein
MEVKGPKPPLIVKISISYWIYEFLLCRLASVQWAAAQGFSILSWDYTLVWRPALRQSPVLSTSPCGAGHILRENAGWLVRPCFSGAHFQVNIFVCVFLGEHLFLCIFRWTSFCVFLGEHLFCVFLGKHLFLCIFRWTSKTKKSLLDLAKEWGICPSKNYFVQKSFSVFF